MLDLLLWLVVIQWIRKAWLLSLNALIWNRLVSDLLRLLSDLLRLLCDLLRL